MTAPASSLQSQLEERLCFETLLTDLSARFVGVPAEDLDREIESAQRRICETLGLDRSTLSLFDGPDAAARFTHSWAVEGFKPSPIANVEKLFPWAAQHIRRGLTLQFSSLDEVPAEANIDKESWRRIGPKSNVTLPLIAGGQVLGALSFGALKAERTWPEPLVGRLRLLADIFASALARRRAEMETQRYLQELAHVSRVSTMGELAGSLAHELNQPLTAILSNVQAAQRYLASNPANLAEVRDILRDVVTENHRASEIITRIRGMIKKDEAPMVPCDLNALIREVLRLLAGDLAARKVTAKVHLEADLPPVLGNRVQLEQVLINLILNACDAMSSLAAVERQLTLSTELPGNGTARVRVQDQGTGFSRELGEKVFEAFYTTKPGGLGLGLPICRSIINSHGGQLWAEPNPDRGASFLFTVRTGPRTKS